MSRSPPSDMAIDGGSRRDTRQHRIPTRLKHGNGTQSTAARITTRLIEIRQKIAPINEPCGGTGYMEGPF